MLSREQAYRRTDFKIKLMRNGNVGCSAMRQMLHTRMLRSLRKEDSDVCIVSQGQQGEAFSSPEI